ncbi:MAG: glycosyltransferase [Sediminibacterium sp.]|nr:glycosyltransferase [Sediminibacterium sp.]
MLLSVIIVHYRVPYFLEQCICSLETALSGIDAEVIVVDNDNSNANPASNIQAAIPLRRIVPEKNIGFAAACNLGWKQASGNWILLLNPDTLVTAAAIRGCLTQIMQDDCIGAIGCRLINGNGNFLPESKRSFPTPFNSAAKMLGLAHLFPGSGIFNRYALGNIAATASCSVEVLTGAFLLTSRSMLEHSKGLDEMYFLYGEDIDFCKQVAAAGKKCWYRGTDAIIHFKGASSPAKGSHYFYHFYKAMIVYCKKHYASPVSQTLQFFIYVQRMLHQLTWNLTQFWISTPANDCFSREVIGIGSEAETSALLAIIGKEDLKSTTIRVYNWQEWISMAGSELSKNANSSILFCIGTMSMQSVIQWLESNPIKNPVFFRHANSTSIVGRTGCRGLTKKGM